MANDKKNIQMQVYNGSGYDELCPVPAEHASSHGKGSSDPITPESIGAVNNSGGIMTGNLKVPSLDVAKDTCGGYIYGEQNTLNFRGGNPSTGIYHYFGIKEDGVYVDNEKIYYPGNKPALKDIAFLGTNPITSTADDTTGNWVTLGSGYAWFKASGQLTDQPSTYGFLISYVQDGDVFQIWNTQAGGPTCFRSGNGSGWNNSWRRAYDTSNKPTTSDVGITAGTTDLTAGTSSLTTGAIYLVYE